MKVFFIALILLFASRTCFSNDFDTIEKLLESPQSSCRQVLSEGVEPSQADCDDCLSEIEQLIDLNERDELTYKLHQRDCTLKASPKDEEPKSGWAIFLDQDVLTLDSWTNLNDDRNYTMGLGGTLQGAAYSKGSIASGRAFLDQLFSSNSSRFPPVEQIHTLDFGVTAFTPNELEQTAPITGDRPYSSLLYFGNSKLVAYNNTAVKTNLVVGLLGLDIAKAVQRYLHNDIGVSDQDPLGWDNQVSEGGELTALYSYEKKFSFKKTSSVDVAYSTGFNAGYYTDVYIGGDVRVGRVNSPYYSFNANPMSKYNHKKCRFCRLKENYGFLSYKLRVVGYNALLQGQFRDSEITINSSDIERVLHEVSAGWTYSISNNWKFTYALHFKSKEYKGIESRDHWFGGLYLSKNY